MLNSNEITAFLQERNIVVSGVPIKDKEIENRFFIFTAVSRDSENRQIPSNKKLDEARQQLAEHSVIIEFLLTNPQSRDIEAGLRATLLHSFGNDLRNIFLSLEKSKASIWLDPKRNLETGTLKLIEEKSRIFLKEFEIEIQSVSLTTNENLPGLLISLRAIRQTAPVDLPTLSQELVRRGFTVPSEDWLRRKLDQMRKTGKVARLEDGRHVLTLSSLRELGTVKGRSSPDVQRMLAIARGR
jgi:hypothetical protein